MLNTLKKPAIIGFKQSSYTFQIIFGNLKSVAACLRSSNSKRTIFRLLKNKQCELRSYLPVPFDKNSQTTAGVKNLTMSKTMAWLTKKGPSIVVKWSCRCSPTFSDAFTIGILKLETIWNQNYYFFKKERIKRERETAKEGNNDEVMMVTERETKQGESDSH